MADTVITAQECRRLMRNASGVEDKLVDQMVLRVEAAIRRSLKQGLLRTSVTVPNFFYGTPEFNRDEVTSSVRAIFANNGFRILDSQCNSHTFDVIWDEDTSKPAAAVDVLTGAAPDSSAAKTVVTTVMKRTFNDTENTAVQSDHKTVKLV
jgi:hypothetical protein